jgi:hypothetical protein
MLSTVVERFKPRFRIRVSIVILASKNSGRKSRTEKAPGNFSEGNHEPRKLQVKFRKEITN